MKDRTEYKATWYRRNRERILPKVVAYYHDHKDKMDKYSREYAMLKRLEKGLNGIMSI